MERDKKIGDDNSSVEKKIPKKQQELAVKLLRQQELSKRPRIIPPWVETNP